MNAGSFCSGSGGGRGPPRPERLASEGAKRAAGSEMTLDIKSVMHGSVG